MTSHSSILAWKIPRTEEPGGPQSMGSQRVRHDWMTEHACRYMACYVLLQGIFLTQGLNSHPLYLLLCRQFFTTEPTGKCVCVCVCVTERERERERECVSVCVYKDTENSLFSSLQIFFFITNAWDEVPQNLLEVK